jgi:hypothetical protein
MNSGTVQNARPFDGSISGVLQLPAHASLIAPYCWAGCLWGVGAHSLTALPERTNARMSEDSLEPDHLDSAPDAGSVAADEATTSSSESSNT